MSTRLHPPEGCHCIPHTNARRRENIRAALWSAIILAAIYLPSYIAYYWIGIQP